MPNYILQENDRRTRQCNANINKKDLSIDHLTLSNLGNMRSIKTCYKRMEMWGPNSYNFVKLK